VLQESDLFSARVEFASSPQVRGLDQLTAGAPLARRPTLSTSDGPAHVALRRLTSAGFSASAAKRLDPHIEARATELAAEFPSAKFDLMEHFADPLARDVGLVALGVASRNLDEFWSWIARIEFARSRPATAAQRAAAEEAVEHLDAYIGALPASTALGSIWEHVDAIGRDTALSVIVQIAAVGSGPTAGAIANSLLALIEHPEQEAWLGPELSDWLAAAEEFLRFDSPAHAVTRFAVRDTTLGGRAVRAGSSVYVMIGSANRDEDVFHEPERLDLGRDARRQLSFGHGPHFCLGAGLARRAIAHALKTLRHQFPHMELVGLHRGQEFELRIPKTLFVAVR